MDAKFEKRYRSFCNSLDALAEQNSGIFRILLY